MSAVLRTARTLVSVPVVITFACAIGLLRLVPRDNKILTALMSLSLMLAFWLLALRIAKVLEAGVWRLLPDGYRTLIRALGLIMLVIFLPSTIDDLADPLNSLPGVPLGGLFSNVIFFTQLSVLLLAGIGRRVRGLVVFAYLIVCSVSMRYLISGFADVPLFWNAAAGLCVAAWLYASFGKLPHLPPGVGWRRLLDLPAIPRLASTRIWTPFIPRSPARELLRSRRSARTGLPFAALIVVLWAVFQHVIVGGRQPVDNIPFVYLSVVWVTAFLMVVLSQDAGAAARTLWLRWGDSRGDLFGLAERALLRDTAILCTTAWGTVTLLAWLRDVPIDAAGALKMLAAYVGAAVTPIYLALAFSTFNAQWQRLICATLCVGAVALLSIRWVDAFGSSREGIGRMDPELILVLLLILLVLRTFAWWRWRRIDWIYFRQIRRKQ